MPEWNGTIAKPKRTRHESPTLDMEQVAEARRDPTDHERIHYYVYDREDREQK